MSSAKDSRDGGGFVFVPISHPSESAGWKRKVRSHAAKGIWARRQRVAAYQQANAQSSSPSDGQYPEGTPPLSSSQHPKALTLVSCRGSSKPDHRNAFPPGPISFLSAARTDPFNSYNRAIAPWEKRLLDHFMQYLILEEMVFMPSLNIDIAGDNVSFWTSICTYFLQASLSDPGMLATTLLYSCRHMAAKQRNEIFSLQATKYRLHCIQSLNQTLTREGKDISQLTIAKTIALASDAYFTGEYDAAEKHLKAVGQMARVKDGGLDSSDFLGRLVIWFAGDAQSKDMIGTLKLNFDTETAPVTKVDKNLVYHVSAPASRDGRD
ncbi:uncharacterized protein LY79DRAFT_571106 [Colletotrichum navitas]|uniref:Uncharacterized protein n=1 Tax=Colletotrichum navitas TaxID=681940 RepID=A0AAD8UZE6_9PEZI|nr:uncharacterized protein LY79DRAFT_571106 [Colletotrichum navitas]KAK1569853.1 hypothetical protein LY79DRAFT_571106 [Colletotrichum navitas]